MEDDDDDTPMATPMSRTPASSPVLLPTATSSPILIPRATREWAHHLRIDLMDLPVSVSEASEDHRIPFFARRRSEHTWVVSLFVVINLVAFVATMLVNDCPGNSGGGGSGGGGGGGDGHCVLRPLGRFSFQPLDENPLLGPSASTLVKMGALRRTLTVKQSKIWPMVISPWLHAGVVHLVVNLSSLVLIGHRLEQEFGSLRAAIIYLLSALLGSLASTIFVQRNPAVGSSSALFGLIGATLAGLIRNWKTYVAKFLALAMLGFVAILNFCIGLLPFVDNFSNIGGFLSGILLGVVLLFNPQISIMERKKGLFDYDLNRSVKLKQKVDKPILRIIVLLLFSMILAGGLVAVLLGINANKRCQWCHYINCVPTKMWSCNERPPACEAMVSDGRLTLTCLVGDKFRTYPFANVSQERLDELCSLICS